MLQYPYGFLCKRVKYLQAITATFVPFLLNIELEIN